MLRVVRMDTNEAVKAVAAAFGVTVNFDHGVTTFAATGGPRGRGRVALVVEAGAPDGVDAQSGELGVSEVEEAVAWITAALRDVRNARRACSGLLPGGAR